MMPASRIRTSAVLAGIAAVALGGCTVVHAPAKGTSHLATASAKAVSAPTQTPARPASEVIPSAARAVTLAMTSTRNKSVKEPAPVTVTDPAKVRRIAALLNGLSLTPPVVYRCPRDFGGTLTLTFEARAAAPALAVVTTDLTGCAFINLTIDGKRQPGLGPANGGLTLADEAFKIVGLNWQVPG